MATRGTRKEPSSAERKPSRASVHELVYQEIRQSLMVGMFAPGEKVSLRSLAQQVGTSLTPVRGAVNRLIAEGAFEVKPNRWVVIPEMSAEKFAEITHWRVELETQATRRAVERFNKKQLAGVVAANKAMLKAVGGGSDRRELLTHNYEFHFSIYRAAESSILLPMIESLWLQAGPFTYFSLLSPRELWDATYHDAIIDALGRNDADAAAEAIKADILNTAAFLKHTGHYEPPRLRRVLA